MSEAASDGITDATLAPGDYFKEEIAALREAGAADFDPVQFHLLQVLARRATVQPASVRRILDCKLVLALARFQQRLKQGQLKANNSITTPPSQSVSRPGPLGLLAQHAAQNTLKKTGSQSTEHAQALHDPKSVQYFRTTWSRLNTCKQVAKAIDQAPKNAGPINSHGLVLKSLVLMRDASPDYLNRFVSYAETLLMLDHCDGGKSVRALTKRPAKTSKP